MIEYDNPPPDLAERYVTACNSGNLRCDTGEDASMGDTAVLIAVGWSTSRVGAALMRLHTKADRNGLEQVHEQMVLQAQVWGIERPVVVSSAVLSWWLSKNCRACMGRKFEIAPGSPSLSNRHCKACKGTGEEKLAYGDAGKRMLEWLESCRIHSVSSIKKRLRPSQ